MSYIVRPEVKGLIFDMDGTLADSMPLHFKAWKIACERFGVKIDSQFLKAQMGVPGWKIAAELLKQNGMTGRIDPQEIIRLKVEEYKQIQTLVEPIVPVAEVVRKYHGILPMAVGTGGHRDAVARTLEIIGLRSYFDIVVTANDVENHKPHPDTFLLCAEKMGVEPVNIDVFEDGDMGIEAAIRAGMNPIDVRSWYDSDWA